MLCNHLRNAVVRELCSFEPDLSTEPVEINRWPNRDRGDIELVLIHPRDFRVGVVEDFLQLRRAAVAIEITFAVFFVDAHAKALWIALERRDDGRRNDVVVEIDVHGVPYFKT